MKVSSSTAVKLATSPSGRHPFTEGSLVPIELMNGCSEEGLQVDSDNPQLTNVIRQHYLLHFGHRDLDGIVSDYAPENAVLVNVVNGEAETHTGRSAIRKSFEGIFKAHDTSNCTFHLKHVIVHGWYGCAIWSATTPTHGFPQASDCFVFNQEGKIINQYFSAHMVSKTSVVLGES